MYRYIFSLIVVSGLVPFADAVSLGVQNPWSVQSAVGNRVKAGDDLAFPNPLGEISGLTTGHMDSDGILDLIVGHRDDHNGLLVVYRGNPETGQHGGGVFPVESAPFVDLSVKISLPFAPDWLGVGDVDGDGSQDVVVGARGRSEILWLAGDGEFNLAPPQRIPLPGPATAWASGEIGVEDDLIDIAVGVETRNGPALVVITSRPGGLQFRPVTIPVPELITAIALGRLDGDDTFDLAAAAGDEVLIYSGRSGGLDSAPGRVVVRTRVHDLAIGRFVPRGYRQLAVLQSDGNVDLAEWSDGSWRTEPVGETIPPSGRAGQGMIAARTGAPGGFHSLVITDPALGGMTIFGVTAIKGSVSMKETDRLGLNAGMAHAVRLNADGRQDLLASPVSGSVPLAVLSRTVWIMVKSNGDADGSACGPSDCSLRQAINEVNGLGFPATIIFDTYLDVIQPQSELPALTQGGSVIDGTVGLTADEMIRLDGSQCTILCSGLTLGGGTATVTNVEVFGFNYNGIYITSDGNVVEGAILGIDSEGLGVGNGNGILIHDANDNTVGGTLSGEGNVVGLNGVGVYVFSGSATPTSNLIYGNEIGATGVLSAGNNIGVFTYKALGTRIGSTTAGAGNVISANNTGILLSESSSDRVTANWIGVTAAGAAAGNTGIGVKISSSPNCWVNAANTIANNGAEGIAVLGAASTSVLLTNNSIFQNGSLGIDLSPTASADGVTANDPSDGDAGANNLQNFPVITGANSVTGEISVSLDPTPNSLFDIYYFSSPSCDSTGYGEARTYLRSTLAITNSGGHYSGVLSGFTLTTGHFITALAIDSNDNSSELAACVEIVQGDIDVIFSDGFESGGTGAWTP